MYQDTHAGTHTHTTPLSRKDTDTHTHSNTHTNTHTLRIDKRQDEAAPDVSPARVRGLIGGRGMGVGGMSELAGSPRPLSAGIFLFFCSSHDI